MACLQAKPIVDGIEQEYTGKLRVLRIDAQSAAGQVLAAQLKLRFTPTFVFFDSQGAEAWRSSGSIDPQKVRESLN